MDDNLPLTVVHSKEETVVADPAVEDVGCSSRQSIMIIEGVIARSRCCRREKCQIDGATRAFSD